MGELMEARGCAMAAAATGDGARTAIAVAVLDGDGQAGQLMHRPGDAILAFPGGGCGGEPVVDVQRALHCCRGARQLGHRSFEGEVGGAQFSAIWH